MRHWEISSSGNGNVHWLWHARRLPAIISIGHQGCQRPSVSRVRGLGRPVDPQGGREPRRPNYRTRPCSK